MNRIIIGIDNGISGGLVALSDHPGPPIAMTIMPIRRHRSRNEVDVSALSEWLHQACGGWPECATYVIEEPNNSRNAGTAYAVASCFHAIRGYLESKRHSWHRITPQSWQKAMIPKCKAGETKIRALAKARELWPDENWLASKRCKTPHAGLVDAALIAEFGRRSLTVSNG